MRIFFHIGSSKKGRGLEISQHLSSKKMVFTSKHNMKMTKSEKLLKKMKKKFFGDFFWYDVIQERAGFRAFLTTVFNILLEQLSNSRKIRLWKFQVNLVSSFGDNSKKAKVGHFCPPSKKKIKNWVNATIESILSPDIWISLKLYNSLRQH